MLTSYGIAYSPFPMTVMYETSLREANCGKHDGYGDGTVPISSGESPKIRAQTSIKQQFRIPGIAHEPAYQNVTVQQVVQYAIIKITAKEALINSSAPRATGLAHLR